MTLVLLTCILTGALISAPIIRTIRGFGSSAVVRLPQRMPRGR